MGLAGLSSLSIAQTNLGDAESLFIKYNAMGKNESSALLIDNNDGTDTIEVFSSNDHMICGRGREEGSILTIQRTAESTEGMYIKNMEQNDAFKISMDENGDLLLTRTNINDVICKDYSNKTTEAYKGPSSVSKTGAWDPYDLQSMPEATAVIFLDFDGYNLPAGTPWNNGAALNAAASGYDDMDILMAFGVVEEDYSPFNINVTTNESVYLNAPAGLRTRVVFTPTSYWSPGGGVALLNSFNWTEALPCWVFSDGFNHPARAAEAGSHEAGHTLGLKHDGQGFDAYYAGHANWAPIMGNSYYNDLTHWSPGDYSGSTETQDDYAMIANNSGGVRTDDHGNTTSNASEILYTLENGNAVLDDNDGIIERRTDKDYFHFYISGGSIDLEVVPTGLPKPNLDLEVKLLDENGSTIATYSNNHSNFDSPVSVTRNLGAGDYYISIDGIGNGNATTGWTDYGSLGQFEITGEIVGIEQKDYDISINGVTNISTLMCGESIAPKVELSNNGKEDISTLSFDVYWNNGLISSQTRPIDLASGASEVFTLNSIPLSSFGSGNISIEIHSPDNETDEVSVNNTFEQATEVQTGQLMHLEISEGSLSEDMSWSLSGANDNVTDQSVTPSQTTDLLNYDFCLAEGCYDFDITDAFVADLCNEFPQWAMGVIYSIGDQMVYQGRVYEATVSIWDVNPVDYPHYYDDLGPCPEPEATDYFRLDNLQSDELVAEMTVANYLNSYNTNYCTSVIQSTASTSISESVIAYPIPFETEIQLNASVQEMQLLNSFGKTVETSTNSSKLSKLDNLPAGTYLLKWKSENESGVIRLQKI